MRTEYVQTETAIPSELLRPVEVRPRKAETLRDVALILTDHRQALDQANTQIVAIGCIVRPEDVADPRSCKR